MKEDILLHVLKIFYVNFRNFSSTLSFFHHNKVITPAPSNYRNNTSKTLLLASRTCWAIPNGPTKLH